MRRAAILIVLTIVGLAVPADGAKLSDEQRREVLAEAQRAYDEGIGQVRADPGEARRLFRSAAERFQLLVDDGVVNGPVLYNLGNALLQSGQTGLAIASYRRAERLMPGDPRLEANLDYARSVVRSQITPAGQKAILEALMSWHRRTTLAARWTAFAVAWIGFWAVLGAALLRPHPAWRYAALACTVIWLACGLSVLADLTWPESESGVLIADEVVLRKGNGEGFEPRFEQPLFQGVEFDLIDRRPGWLHVRLRDGSTGWVRDGQARLIDTS